MSTFIATPGLSLPPRMPVYQTLAMGATLATLANAGDRAAYILQVPKAGTLGKVHFSISSITTNHDLKISFQDVDFSNTPSLPDGSIDQFRVLTPAAGWNTTGLVTSDGTNTGTKRTVSQGDFLAVVIQFDSTVGNLTVELPLLAAESAAIASTPNFPFTLRNSGGVWSANNRGLGAFALEYDDGSFAELETVGCLPTKALNSTSVNSSSTPDEVGMRFVAPFDCKVDGCWAFLSTIGDLQMVLYDTDGTSVLASVTIDKDTHDASGSNLSFFKFTATATLTSGGVYRLIVKPTTTTNVSVFYWDVNSNSLFGACALGIDAYWTQRTDAGSWSQTDTRRPWMGVSLYAVDINAVTDSSETAFTFVGGAA